MPAPSDNNTSGPPPPPSRSLNKYTIAKALVAVGLLTWLVRSGRLDFRALFDAPFSRFHFLGMLVLLTAMVLQAWRWWSLLRIQQIDLSFPRTLGLVWIGRFLALVLPGVVGGDLVLGYYVTREAPSAKTAGLSTVLLDRSIGFYTSFLLGVAAFGWLVCSGGTLSRPLLHMGAVIILCTFGATLVFLILWLAPIRDRILGFVPGRLRTPLEGALDAYRAGGRGLMVCLVLSLAISVMSMAAYKAAGRVIDTPLGWKQVLMVCPLVFVATALPISPGGIGVGETAASVLFAQFGVETGATIMLVVRLWFLALRMPGALFYVFRGRSTALDRS